ncbi:MAG: glycosyltransferase [Hyphomonadaceae bacterium]
MFVLNGMPHVERAIRSVLAQDYANWEFVIQDGGSNDGTVEFIKGLNDPRIKLVSEKDDGPADAFAKAVTRCRGEILASCLFDEELMPNALSRAESIFREHPHLGAITGDAHISDIWGRVYAKFTGAPFNLLKYLMGEYCPYWCSSFFKVDALRFAGIFDQRWSKASLEFEIWVRLAIETDILYVPEIFSKYAHHTKQLSQTGPRVAEEIEARMDIIRDHLFGPGKYFGTNTYQCDVFCLMQLINLHRHMSDWNPAEAPSVLKRITDAGYLGEFNAARRRSAAHAAGDFALATHASDMAFAEPGRMTGLAGTLTSGPAGALLPPGTAQQIHAYDGAPNSRVPMNEFILPRRSAAGRVYAVLTPVFIRKMIPRDLKVKLAYKLGLRK